jgi:hypothetical protein
VTGAEFAETLKGKKEAVRRRSKGVIPTHLKDGDNLEVTL